MWREVSRGGVEYSGSMEVSSVERLAARPLDQPPPLSPGRPRPPPFPRPRIRYILTEVDDVGGLMDGLCDVDASSLCAMMRWSSLIRRKTNLVI